MIIGENKFVVFAGHALIVEASVEPGEVVAMATPVKERKEGDTEAIAIAKATPGANVVLRFPCIITHSYKVTCSAPRIFNRKSQATKMGKKGKDSRIKNKN